MVWWRWVAGEEIIIKSMDYLKIVQFFKDKEREIFKNIIQDFCILEGGGGRNNINIAIRLL